MNDFVRMIDRQAGKARELKNTAALYRQKAKQAEADNDAQAAANWNELADRMESEYIQTVKGLKAFHPVKEGLSIAEQNYLQAKSEGRNEW